MKSQVLQELTLEKRLTEQSLTCRGQLVDSGSEMDAGREGPDYGKRDYHHLDKVVKPGDLYVSVLVNQRKQWILFVLLNFLLCHLNHCVCVDKNLKALFNYLI